MTGFEERLCLQFVQVDSGEVTKKILIDLFNLIRKYEKENVEDLDLWGGS